MAATGKKKMKAKLKVEAWSEMKPKQKQWVMSNPALKKAFKPVEYSEDMMLDPRKWDERKLADGMKAIVRYELKLLDMAVFRWQKEVEKKGPLAQLKAEKDLPALYGKMVKTIQDKLSVALDEVAADLGDNKKGLKGCREVLDALKGASLQAMFLDTGEGVKNIYAGLSTALKSDDPTDKGSSAAYDLARKQFNKVLSAYEDEADINNTIDSISKLADSLIKDKNANPRLIEFGRDLRKDQPVFDKVNNSIALAWDDLDDVEQDLDGEINKDAAKRKSLGSAEWAKYAKSGRKAEMAVAKLRKQFDPIYKELKK